MRRGWAEAVKMRRSDGQHGPPRLPGLAARVRASPALRHLVWAAPAAQRWSPGGGRARSPRRRSCPRGQSSSPALRRVPWGSVAGCRALLEAAPSGGHSRTGQCGL
eukprot:13739826-Alexandrium_andersonii.AAC.1